MKIVIVSSLVAGMVCRRGLRPGKAKAPSNTNFLLFKNFVFLQIVKI